MANDNIVSNYCDTFIQITNDVTKKYESNVEIIKQTEDELQDLMHEIELGKPQDMYGGYKLYKQVKDLRMKRRQCKNENELLKDMYEYIKSQPGQAFKSKMQSIQGNSVKVHEVQSRRNYTPRQRSDLTITDRPSTANKPFQEMLDDFNKNKAYMKNGKLRK